jgi:hypothetical protein
LPSNSIFTEPRVGYCKLALGSRNALHFSKLAQNPSARSLPKNPIEVEVETAGFRLPTIRQPPCPQRVFFGRQSSFIYAGFGFATAMPGLCPAAAEVLHSGAVGMETTSD